MFRFSKCLIHQRLVFTSLVFLISSTLLASDSQIVGRVTDANNETLPGVTVSVQSANLQGTRQTVSDADGEFRLVFIPPGAYELTATMAGFHTHKTKIVVKLDATTQANISMRLQAQEEAMVVTADLPAIDPTSTTAGANFNEEFFSKIPTGRSVASIFDLAPGVGDLDSSNTYSINGSTGPENQFIFNGVNVSGIELGDQYSNLNFDFVQEVQVKTGGYEAEYGRATGGILNVLTKSGGNDFSGSVFTYLRDRDMSASARFTPPAGATELGRNESDIGFTLGGPLIKDRLWFFAGFNPTDIERINTVPSDNLPGSTTNFQQLRGESETKFQERTIDKWSVKLTYQLNQSNNLVFSAFGEPQEAIFRDATGTQNSDSVTKFDSDNYVLQWQSILNDTFTLDAHYALSQQGRNDSAANGNNLSRIFRFVGSSIYDIGGVGFLENSDAERSDITIKLGAYFYNHNLKIGAQYEETSFADARDYSGLGNARILNSSLRVRTFARVNANGDFERISPQYAKTENAYTSLFVQDSWTVTNNLSVNLGLRYEEQELLNSTGGTYHTFDDNLAPRIGVTWDFLGDGSSKAYGHYGRYFQSLPMDINNRAAAPEILFFQYYSFDELTPTAVADWTEADVQRLISTQDPFLELDFGSGFTSIDPNSKATNHDEIILGVDWEFKPNWVVGFKYINRKLNDAIEDISFDAGNNYIIGNPGGPITFTNADPNNSLEFYDFQENFVSVAPGETATLSPEQVGFPTLTRDYNGYEFLLQKRFSNNYQFQASYVHSSTKGNYIGSVLGTQVDPGITALFDIPSTTVNGEGLLPQHRRHRIKLDGSYTADFGLNIGASFRYLSGKGLDALGNPDTGNGAYSEFHLLPRGSAGQVPDFTQLDLKFDYEFNIAQRYKLGVYLDIFNVLDLQSATELDDQFSSADIDASEDHWEWNQGQASPNTGDEHNDAIIYANRYYSWIEGRFNNVSELSDWYNANGLSVESDTYGKPTEYQVGRTLRVGARFQF